MVAEKLFTSSAVALAIAFAPAASSQELRHRKVTIDDSLGSLPVLHVAPGLATGIAFQAPLRDATFVRPVGQLFQKLTRTDRTVVVVPIDVTIALRSAPDSPEALKSQATTLRARLDECQGTSESAGAGKIAALILAQGLDAPQAFETHALRGGDRQNRLLVQARRVYRLLGLTYVIVSVDNR